MSWQANECFVFGIEYGHEGMNGRMLDAMNELLWLYGEHGDGWYLLGDFDGEREGDPFELYGNGSWGCGWLPNPFMNPNVMALRVRNPNDLMHAAFECADGPYGVIAYAGDGPEPLERVVIYGKEHDLRA